MTKCFGGSISLSCCAALPTETFPRLLTFLAYFSFRCRSLRGCPCSQYVQSRFKLVSIQKSWFRHNNRTILLLSIYVPIYMVIIRSRISSTIRAPAKIQNTLISLLRNNVIMQVSSAGILTLDYLDSTQFQTMQN